MASLADIKFYLAGTDGTVGGAKGANQWLSQTATGLTTITGVTIDDAAGNAVGNGVLYFYSSTKTLVWSPPGSSSGTAVDVSVNGSYVIQGASNGGVLNVTVVAASLPGSNLNNTITIANKTNELYDDVSKAESYAGMTRYRAVYLCNSVSDKTAFKLWIAENTPGLDTLAIGLDPAGAGGTAATIANETTAPVGVTFSSPANETDALSIGALTSTQNYPFWIRETIPAGCDVATAVNTARLAFSVLL